MTTYSSIRIYIPLGNSITPGFYNVVGYFGASTISPSNGWYNINLNNEVYPLIISNQDYYYLSYDSENGYSVNAISQLQYIDNLHHPIVSDTEMTIYQDKVGDFNTVGIGYPINGNISIVGLSSLRAAYRTYTMDVYDNYAIQKFGSTIYDEYNIIDLSEEEIMLVETNPDHYVFDPSAGSNVDELYHFTVDCRKNIDVIHKSVDGNSICIYEKNTKSVVARVNQETIEYSGTSFSFYLQTKLTTSGVYFLYLPSNSIEFVNGTKSPFTMIGYKINVIEDLDDIQLFEYQSMGKTLDKIRIKFLNTGNYSIGLDRTKIITISGPLCNKTISSSVALSLVLNNTVQLDTKESIINLGTSNETYYIDIPVETFQLSETVQSDPIRLTFTLIPLSESLPEDHSLIIKFDPADTSKIFKLDKFTIKFYLDRYLENKTEVYPLSGKTILVKNSGGSTITSTGTYTDSTEYDEGYKIYAFTYTLSNPITTPGVYKIYVPAETFKIGSGNDVNKAVECTYLLIKLNEEHGLNKYCYEMLEVIPTTQAALNENGGANLSFKKNETIFVNLANLDLINLSPAITIIETDDNNTKKATYYNPQLPENLNDVLEMSATLSVLMSSGEWKHDVVMYNKTKDSISSSSGFYYGMSYDLRRSYKLYNLSLGNQLETDGIFFKDERLGEIPRKMQFAIYIKLNGYAVEYGTEIQLLEEAVYNKYKENNNWVEQGKIDIYSGEECRRVYYTPNETNEYDSLVKETILGNNGQPITRYQVDLKCTTKVRLGNLNGIFDETFGTKQPFGYGLYGQNVFLTGNFYLNNGRSLVDVDNDITLAVGDITRVLNNLKSLDDRLSETSNALDLKIESAEQGVSSTISNYISTNRDAIFKLGLDYSMWSLGSAGISLYNPNVRYTTDEYGERVVDPSTVGDFDEGILVQADRLRINNYSSITVNNKVYYKLLITSVNPKDWYYPNQDSTGLFFPKSRDVKTQESKDIPFYYVYIAQESFDNSNIYLDSTLGCEEVLRYVYILDDDQGNPFVPQTINGVDNYTAYAFNSFYSAPANSVTFYKYSNNTLSDAYIHDQIWFLPAIVQAAMFHNGKIYAKYIDTEGLSVEHVIAIPKDLTPYDPSGAKNIRKNEAFDISKPITDSNYPVIMDVGTFTPDAGGSYITIGPCKTVPFVVVSGYEGKITARSADISGRLIIGDESADISKYIVITDNVSEDTAVEHNSTPAMYIMQNLDGSTTQLAKFSGDNEGDLSRKYLNLDESSETINFSDSRNVSIKHEKGTSIVPAPGVSLDDIIGSNDRNNLTGYKISSNLANGERQTMLDISASNDIRSAKIECKVLSMYANNDTLNLYINAGYLSGYTLFVITIFIRDKSDISYSNPVKITSFEDHVSFNYNGIVGFQRFNTTKSVRITLAPSLSGYEVYYTLTDLSNYVVLAKNVSLTNYPLTFNLRISLLRCEVNLGKLEYMAQFTGNGLSLGFDKNNYFSSYYINNDLEDSQLRMVTQFRSAGIGMAFDVGNLYYLFPSNIRMPMAIPFIYFSFDTYGENSVVVPMLNGDTLYRKYAWFLSSAIDGFKLFEIISPLVNIHAMSGVGTTYYTYDHNFSDGTPRERLGREIKLNNDAIYEINYKKLIDAVKASSGANINKFCIVPNVSRQYACHMNGNQYFTHNSLTEYTPKLEEVSDYTVYITIPLDDSEGLYKIIGSINMFTPYYKESGGSTINTYTVQEMNDKIQYYSGILDGFKDRFLALASDDLRAQVDSMLLSYENGVNALRRTNSIPTVDNVTNDLDTLGPQIEAKLTELENSGSGLGDDPVNPSGSEAIITTEPTATAVDDIMHAEHSSGNPLPNTAFVHKYLGYIESGASSYNDTPVSYGIYVKENGVGNMVHNVSVEPSSTSGHSYDIYADVYANSVTAQKAIHLWIQFPNANQLGYINVYQDAASSSTQCSDCSARQSRFLSTQLTYANGGQGVGIADSAGYSTSRVIGELKGCTSAPNTTFTITAGSENVGNINTFISAWSSVTISLVTPDRVLSELQAGQNETDAHGDSDYLIVASRIPANTSGGYIHAHFTPSCGSSYISFKQNYSSSTPQEDTPLQAKLRLFVSDGGADLDVDDTSSDIYEFISDTYNTALSYSSGISLNDITADPIVSTGSTFNSDSRDGWLLGLILTLLYPFKKTSGITSINSGTAAQTCKNHQPLDTAFTRWGYGNNTSSISDISDYQQKYNGMMLAGILFSKLFSSNTFVNDLKEIKQKNYTSGYIKSYTYNDGTDFLSSKLGLDGKEIFPLHPGTSTSPSSSNKLMIRDNTAYTDGKNTRNYTLGTVGRRAYDDRCDALNYLIDLYCAANSESVSAKIGTYTEKYGVGSLNEAGIDSRYYLGSNYTSYNGRNSYLEDGSEYGSDSAWRTFLLNNRSDILSNKKFLYIYLCMKSGTRTGSHMKGNGDYARTRPFVVYGESKYDSDNDTSNNPAGSIDHDTYALDLNSSTGQRTEGTSYPSGHTGYSWGIALSWNALFGGSASYTNNLFKRAYQYSEGRVIVGAHWQHCVEVGRLTASCGFVMLAANESFLNVLLEARS